MIPIFLGKIILYVKKTAPVNTINTIRKGVFSVEDKSVLVKGPMLLFKNKEMSINNTIPIAREK
jgi:hypothetical protein